MTDRNVTDPSQTPSRDPRVQVDSYVVYPTGYEDMVHTDKDAWCLTVQNGHAYGWSIRRGIGMTGGGLALNRSGEWVVETRGSSLYPRRWTVDEAIRIALQYVDTLRLNGYTAAEASADVAARAAVG